MHSSHSPSQKAVFFDFDGVLHNTFDFHLARINDHYGIALTPEDFKSMHDGNFYHADIPEVQNLDWQTYAQSVRDEQGALVMHPYIKETLGTLARRYHLFLVTSGFRMQIEAYLRNNNVLRCFVDAQFREDSVTKEEKFNTLIARYDLNVRECVFVTDTLGDVLEAHKVSMSVIAVTFGFHSKRRLLEGKPTTIVDSWTEIPNAIQGVLG